MPQVDKGSILVFQKKKHALNVFLAVVGDAPHVEVSVDNLSLEPHENNIVEFIKTKPEDVPKAIVFYKLEGKMILLSGHAQAVAEIKEGSVVIKGRLISTPALKKARIVEYEAPPENTSPIPPLPDFGNRPRWKNNNNSTRDQYRGPRK